MATFGVGLSYWHPNPSFCYLLASDPNTMPETVLVGFSQMCSYSHQFQVQDHFLCTFVFMIATIIDSSFSEFTWTSLYALWGHRMNNNPLRSPPKEKRHLHGLVTPKLFPVPYSSYPCSSPPPPRAAEPITSKGGHTTFNCCLLFPKPVGIRG